LLPSGASSCVARSSSSATYSIRRATSSMLDNVRASVRARRARLHSSPAVSGCLDISPARGLVRRLPRQAAGSYHVLGKRCLIIRTLAASLCVRPIRWRVEAALCEARRQRRERLRLPHRHRHTGRHAQHIQREAPRNPVRPRLSGRPRWFKSVNAKNDVRIDCGHMSGLLARRDDRWPRWVPRSSPKQHVDLEGRRYYRVLWTLGSSDRHLDELSHPAATRRSEGDSARRIVTQAATWVIRSPSHGRSRAAIQDRW
jgi:hypothetical protein